MIFMRLSQPEGNGKWILDLDIFRRSKQSVFLLCGIAMLPRISEIMFLSCAVHVK